MLPTNYYLMTMGFNQSLEMVSLSYEEYERQVSEWEDEFATFSRTTVNINDAIQIYITDDPAALDELLGMLEEDDEAETFIYNDEDDEWVQLEDSQELYDDELPDLPDEPPPGWFW